MLEVDTSAYWFHYLSTHQYPHPVQAMHARIEMMVSTIRFLFLTIQAATNIICFLFCFPGHAISMANVHLILHPLHQHPEIYAHSLHVQEYLNVFCWKIDLV